MKLGSGKRKLLALLKLGRFAQPSFLSWRGKSPSESSLSCNRHFVGSLQSTGVKMQRVIVVLLLSPPSLLASRSGPGDRTPGSRSQESLPFWGPWVDNFFKASALWADAFFKSICSCVCLSVCPCVLRYRLNFFLPPLPEVGCPIFLEIQNPWGKVT